MNDTKAWWAGCSVLFFFVLTSELTVVFNEYVYGRLGLNRNALISALWVLPICAAFLVSYFSNKKILLKASSLVVILSVLGPIAHFLSGQLGARIDFAGLSGLKATMPIYVVLSVLTIGVGTAVGVFFKKR